MVRTTWEIMDKSESFMKALGKITSRYALLEELIIGCINILVGGECASILTAGLPFSRSLTILGAIYRQKYNLTQDEDYPVLLKKLLTQAEKAEIERNNMIHSMWQSTRIRGALIRTKRNITRKKGLKIEWEIILIQDLNKTADIIQKAVETALDFTYEILKKYITSLLYPTNGAFVDSKPKFSWLPVDGAIGYELVVSERPTFTEFTDLSSENDTDSIRSTTYACEIPLQQNRTYYWRVRPIIATEKGYWSEVGEFTVK